MLEPTDIPINEERIKKYLLENKRLDKRSSEEFRDIKIETGVSNKAEGSARVRLGKTEVIVGVKMDAAEPFSDTPNKGNLITNAELIPLSSLKFGEESTKTEAIELGRVIDRGIRESGFLDFEKLCIKEGEKVWNVFIDIYSINDDGNLLDAAGIGAIVALKNAEIPQYDEENEKVVYGKSSGEKLPLAKEIPLSITIYKVGENLIVDPFKEEERASETRITSAGYENIIFSMQKGGEGSLYSDRMSEVLDLAEKVRKELILKIKDFL